MPSPSRMRIDGSRTRTTGYVTALVNGTELKRAFLDGGASINLMPLPTFKKLEIPEDRVVRSPITITGFGGDRKRSLGSVVVNCHVHDFKHIINKIS